MYYWIVGAAIMLLLIVFIGAALVAGSRDDDRFGRDFQAWRAQQDRREWP